MPDISNKVIYVGKDKNNDGDIQDKGEVNVWVSENNAAGYSLQNIMAVEPGADGAIYLLKAGDQADVEDRIYRTVDKNNDGDANDAGEMSIYVADSELPKLTFGTFTVPNAFAGLDLVNYQGDLYVLDAGIGSGEARIYRLRDSNSDGQIKANEISLFFQASDIYTRDTEQVMQRLTADDKGIYLLHEPFYYYDRQIGTYKDFEPKDRRIMRLTDSNNDGKISAQEVTTEWTAESLPSNDKLYRGWGIARNNTQWLITSIDDRGVPPTYTDSAVWLVQKNSATVLLRRNDASSLGILNPRGVAFTYRSVNTPPPPVPAINWISLLLMAFALLILAIAQFSQKRTA